MANNPQNIDGKYLKCAWISISLRSWCSTPAFSNCFFFITCILSIVDTVSGIKSWCKCWWCAHTFRATINFVLRSRARYTSPNFPLPRGLPISKSFKVHFLGLFSVWSCWKDDRVGERKNQSNNNSLPLFSSIAGLRLMPEILLEISSIIAAILSIDCVQMCWVICWDQMVAHEKKSTIIAKSNGSFGVPKYLLIATIFSNIKIRLLCTWLLTGVAVRVLHGLPHALQGSASIYH